MSQESTIREGREFNEALMLSTCKAFNLGPKTLDKNTGKNTKPEVELYTGKCKIRVAAASAGISEREPLGQQLAVQISILSLPVAGTGAVKKNTMIRILTNPDDDALVGQEFRVKGFHHQTSATQRRFIVEQVS